MPLNDTAMQVAADALRTALAYAQLHSGAAGDGTANVIAATGREAVSWTAASGSGVFALSEPIEFSGGTSGAPVYSLTLWSADTAGIFYGEFPLTGDNALSAAGEMTITVLDVTGEAFDEEEGS